jgi:hypothetical protein
MYLDDADTAGPRANLNFHTVSGRDINKRIAETDYKIFNT